MVFFLLIPHLKIVVSKSGIINEVEITAKLRARPLIAPSTSPISIAFAVPTAWLAVPIASHLATGDLINLVTNGAITAPVIPVVTVIIVIKAPSQPNLEPISSAIAVITDFGKVA